MIRILVFMAAIVFVSASPAQQPGEGLTEMSERLPAPDFELNDIDGNSFRLSDHAGHIVIVNFWATWCPPCREEMPSMQRVWERMREEGVLMIGINVGEDEDTIFQFTADYPVDFPLLMDSDSKVTGQWSVRGLPTTYVVDPDGYIAYRAIGSREWDAPNLMAQIRMLR